MTIAVEEAERNPTFEAMPTPLQVGVDAVAAHFFCSPHAPAPQILQLCEKALLREPEFAAKVAMAMLAFHYADRKRHRCQFEHVAMQSITRVRLGKAHSDRIGQAEQHFHQWLVEAGRSKFSWPKYLKKGFVWNATVRFGSTVASRYHLYRGSDTGQFVSRKAKGNSDRLV